MTMRRADFSRAICGRILVLLALLVLCSCNHVTQSRQSQPLGGSGNSGSGSIALSGNGEAYQGGGDEIAFHGHERSPGFTCGSTLLGYGSSVITQTNTSIIWSTDPCDASSDQIFANEGGFSLAAHPDQSDVSGKFFSASGRIYEQWVSSESTDLPFAQDTYRTEAWCVPLGPVGPDGHNTEVTIQLSPGDGARTATLYLLWKDDPITHQPLVQDRLDLIVWKGQSAPFPVSRIDSGANRALTGKDFSLSIGPALDPTVPYRRAAHLRVTLYGLESGFDLACVWAGN